MYRTAGAFVPGTDGFSSSGLSLNGALYLRFPTGCGSSSELKGALSSGGLSELAQPAGLDDCCYVTSSYSAELKGGIIFSGAVTDAAEGNLKAESAVSLGGSLEACLSISGGLSGQIKGANTIGDSALCGMVSLRGEISLNSLCGSLFLKSSVDDDIGIIQCSFRFLLNGKDLTGKLVSAVIGFYGKDPFASFSAVVTEPAEKGSGAEFVIEGSSYFFVIEKIKRAGHTLKISGRAAKVMDEPPYGGRRSVFMADTSASALAGSAVWSVPDFSVPLVRGSFSESELLRALADECGASVRIGADGLTRVVNPYSAENSLSPGTFFEAVRTCEQPKYGGIRVVSGLSADPVIEPDAKKTARGNFVTVSVYANGDVKISTDAAFFKPDGLRVIEKEEKIRFSDGAGKASYPVLRLLSGADAAEGRSVYVREGGSFVRNVRYETIRRDCLLYEEVEKDAVLRAEAVKTVFCAGSGTAVKEFRQKLTGDPLAAAARAQNLKRGLCGGVYLEVAHLFSPEAASGDALLMRTSAGEGYCVSSSVEITSAPLKIIQKTKLYLREE
ncbi:MAG: hypothetical protein AB7E48_01435 [Deferribacterales bacterium]